MVCVHRLAGFQLCSRAHSHMHFPGPRLSLEAAGASADSAIYMARPSADLIAVPPSGCLRARSAPSLRSWYSFTAERPHRRRRRLDKRPQEAAPLRAPRRVGTIHYAARSALRPAAPSAIGHIHTYSPHHGPWDST